MEQKQKTRICFCIPEDYSEIMSLLTQFNAQIVNANSSPAEIDEFLAWHVDEFIDVIITSESKADANEKLLAFFGVSQNIGVHMTAVTTAVYESLSETDVTGILYYREGHDPEIKARTTYDVNCTEVNVRTAFTNSGMDAEKIERLWDQMMPVYVLEDTSETLVV